MIRSNKTWCFLVCPAKQLSPKVETNTRLEIIWQSLWSIINYVSITAAEGLKTTPYHLWEILLSMAKQDLCLSKGTNASKFLATTVPPHSDITSLWNAVARTTVADGDLTALQHAGSTSPQAWTRLLLRPALGIFLSAQQLHGFLFVCSIPAWIFASRRELPMQKAETLSYPPRSETTCTEYCSFAVSRANFNDTFVVIVFVKEFLGYWNWMAKELHVQSLGRVSL